MLLIMLFGSLFGEGDRNRSKHNRRTESLAERIEDRPGWDITGVDRTDLWPDPPSRNGRIVDIKARGPDGRTHGFEVDSTQELSGHDRDQMRDLNRYAHSHRNYEDVTRLGPEDDLSLGFDSGFDSGLDLGFGDRDDRSRWF